MPVVETDVHTGDPGAFEFVRAFRVHPHTGSEHPEVGSRPRAPDGGKDVVETKKRLSAAEVDLSDAQSLEPRDNGGDIRGR